MIKNQKKIFVLVPDGVSLRNFAYTNFCKQGKLKGFNIIFWHHTPFDLNSLNLNNLVLEKPRLNRLTNILKNVRKRVEISLFAKREKDDIYYSYLFPLNFNGIKKTIISLITNFLVFCLNSEKGLKFIRRSINTLEQSTTYFKHCLYVLETQKPDLIFCTSQRNVLAISPLLAAKKLKIPTMSFVFSWDNLPKATLDVTSDYYVVWSEYMKRELLLYYPFINDNQVEITGTPQFESHYVKENLLNKVDFFSKYNLDINTSYFCYSGDDYTTSPKDPLYLRDVAIAIRKLNSKGHCLGLIFRRCPVDFSNRYDKVLKEFDDVIVPVEPEWKKIGGAWDTIMPMPEDSILLKNIAAHTKAVINLGSSMVFDFAIHKKPCLYMNYNYFESDITPQFGVYVYNYVHFRSKPTQDVVIWLNHPDDILESIQVIMYNNSGVIENANNWYNKINKQPANMASSRILDSFDKIISKQ